MTHEFEKMVPPVCFFCEHCTQNGPEEEERQKRLANGEGALAGQKGTCSAADILEAVPREKDLDPNTEGYQVNTQDVCHVYVHGQPAFEIHHNLNWHKYLINLVKQTRKMDTHDDI